MVAKIRVETPLLAQYAVAHYLEQERVVDADVEGLNPMSDQPPRIPPKETANFGPLRAMTETNCEENNPRLVRALKKNRTV